MYVNHVEQVNAFDMVTKPRQNNATSRFEFCFVVRLRTSVLQRDTATLGHNDTITLRLRHCEHDSTSATVRIWRFLL
jgi:hypothetical protein